MGTIHLERNIYFKDSISKFVTFYHKTTLYGSYL